MHIFYDSAIPTQDIPPRETLAHMLRKRARFFTVVLFVIVENWKQPKLSPAGEWINKLWYSYIVE